jgi:hypothetical protein
MMVIFFAWSFTLSVCACWRYVLPASCSLQSESAQNVVVTFVSRVEIPSSYGAKLVEIVMKWKIIITIKMSALLLLFRSLLWWYFLYLCHCWFSDFLKQLVLSIYLSIYLSICGSTALVDLGLFFSSLIYTQSVGLLGRGISPSQGQSLPTHRTTQTQNKHTDIHASSGTRTHDPSVRVGEGGWCPRPRGHCDRIGK